MADTNNDTTNDRYNEADRTRIEMFLAHLDDVWVRIANLPRPIAESWRVLLDQHDIPSVLKTPWGWITTTNIIELEAGTYYGGVSLFVRETQLEAAREVLGLEAGDDGLVSRQLE